MRNDAGAGGGPRHPRTHHRRRGVDCHRCHVAAGDACVTDGNGVHLARMATAARLQVITKIEFLAVIPDDFTPTTVVEDPGGPP